MQVVIPMAGHGKRFADEGYDVPKPLIHINKITMIELVVNNLNLDGTFFFICRKDHYEKYFLSKLLKKLKPNCEIILVDQVTDGAARTVLQAKDLINNDDELIIANSDQWVDWNSSHFLSFMRRKEADGGILTFLASENKWSFVRINKEGEITEIAEKNPISNIATVGLYYFKKGKYFVQYAEKMINNNLKINNEFYVAPVYNGMIGEGKKIYPYPVAEMRGLGTPDDLKNFLRRNIL